MPKRQNKDIIIAHKQTVENLDGLKKTTTNQKIRVAQEPDYIKLYLNTLLTFKDLPKQMNNILFELIQLMTFANKEAEHGGQLIILNMFVKQEICNRLNIKDNTFKKALTNFKKVGILKHIGSSTYQANPHMFGRGQWIDIKSIRATFDFNSGTVEADIEHDEPLSFLERAAAGKFNYGDDDEASSEQEFE